MHADDSDRAAILARRRRFILLALTGVAPLTAACSTAQPCLSIGRPEPELDPTTTVCPAEIGEPAALLKGTQIRLPEGVTPEALDQVNPDYRRLASLQTYVLVSQTPPLVEVYRRSGDVWQYQAAGPGQRLELDDGLILDIDALYHSGLTD